MHVCLATPVVALRIDAPRALGISRSGQVGCGSVEGDGLRSVPVQASRDRLDWPRYLVTGKRRLLPEGNSLFSAAEMSRRPHEVQAGSLRAHCGRPSEPPR